MGVLNGGADYTTFPTCQKAYIRNPSYLTDKLFDDRKESLLMYISYLIINRLPTKKNITNLIYSNNEKPIDDFKMTMNA